MEECTNFNNDNHGKSKKYYYYNSNINSNNSINNTNEGGLGVMIRKGPWKAKEDQVLINHVKNYGPRDWSSIRSKGLLQRTGKSCRLRWVNKLRPNLKNGCKFTAEEERMVIQLQGEFGNKWAKIATYLVGRTDNDVKNFWSSRQKTLARLLYSQSPSRSNKKHKSSASTSEDSPRLREVTKNSSIEGESSSKAQSLNSSSNNSADKNTMELIPLPGPVDHSCPCFEANNATYLDPIPFNTYYNNMDLQLLEMPSFPSIPHFQTNFPFLPETQELIYRLDYSFFAPFGCTNEPALINDGVHLFSCFGGGGMSGETRVKWEMDNHAVPNSFFDDFPSDVFDDIEPLPSPPRW